MKNFFSKEKIKNLLPKLIGNNFQNYNWEYFPKTVLDVARLNYGIDIFPKKDYIILTKEVKVDEVNES